MSNWFWYIPGPVVVGGYGYFYFRNYRRRTAGLATAAKERGWVYTEQSTSLLRKCRGVPFEFGRRPRAWHEITGEHRGLHFSSYEYSEVVGRDDPESSERPEREFLRVFGVGLEGPVADVTVTPRGAIGRLALKASVVSGKTGNAAFDRQWSVRADNADAIPTMLPPELLAWFMAAKENQRAFRFRAGEVLCWEPGRVDIDRVEPTLEYLHRLLAHLGTRKDS
jgi:hypothetical protein